MMVTEKGARGRHPQVDGGQRRRHPAGLLRRGALHRPAGPGGRGALGIAGCRLLGHSACPCRPDVYYIEKLPVVMRAGRSPRSAWRRWGFAAWPPFTRPSGLADAAGRGSALRMTRHPEPPRQPRLSAPSPNACRGPSASLTPPGPATLAQPPDHASASVGRIPPRPPRGRPAAAAAGPAGLTKLFQHGGPTIDVLEGSTSSCARARWSRWSAPRARANRPCCTSWARSTRRRGVHHLRRGRRTRCAGAAGRFRNRRSASSSSSTTCCPSSPRWRTP